MIKVNEYCIFFLFDLGTSMNFILLGDSYLKGNLVIHDIDNKRVGLFPQSPYYPPRDFQENGFIVYLVLLFAAAIVAAILIAYMYNKF